MKIPMLLILFGLLLLVMSLVFMYGPLVVKSFLSRRQRAQDHLDQVLDEAPTGTDRVHHAGQKSVLTVDGEPTPVAGSGELLELKFYGGDKKNKVHVSPRGETLREFTILSMTDGGLLTQQPEGEAKSLKFYLYEDRSEDLPRAFADYLHGTDGKPGPAARFAASKQGSDELIVVLGAKWTLTDLLWADLKVNTGHVLSVSTASPLPRLVMILAQNNKDGKQWLLYIEPRTGNLSPMLFVGRQFKPDVEVQAR